MTRLLPIGAPAPDFDAPIQDGSRLRLSSLRGRWVVLFFYPKDETPGCIAEVCSFRDSSERFEAAGAVVVGVSRDGVASHAAFAKRRSLPFALAADPDASILRDYGVLRWYGVARRVTYLIDPSGRVRKVYSSVRPATHVEEVVSDLERLVRTDSARVEPVSADT